MSRFFPTMTDERRQQLVIRSCWGWIIVICVTLALCCRTAGHGGLTGDFPAFYWAGVRLPLGENIYQATPYSGNYIYPPLLAAIFVPLSKLDQGSAAWMWTVINIVLFAVCILLGARHVVRRFGIPGGRAAEMGIAVLAMLLSVGKVHVVVSGGQTDMLLVLGCTLGLIYQDRRPWLAGAMLALAANIKYTPLLLLPYLLLRRRWSAAAWTVVFFVVFGMLPALVCGWDHNLKLWGMALGGVARLFGYQGAELFKAGIGSAVNWHSISITSTFSRVMRPDIALVVSASIALVVGAASWRMYVRRSIPFFRPSPATESVLVPVEWSCMLIGILAFSPQTQGRHLVMLLPAWIVIAALLARPAADVTRRWLIVGVVAAQAAINLPPGSRMFEAAVNAWRAVGGASWGLLILWFGLLWTGLKAADALRRIEPVSPAV
jgi:hypothetical protein